MISLFTGAAIISFAAVFVRAASVGADTSAFYRMVFGGLALAVLMWRQGALGSVNRKVFIHAAVCGLFFALDIMCWHRSILYLGPGMATLLGNLQVFVLTGVSVFVFRDRPGSLFYLGVPLALLGLYLIVGLGWESATQDHRAGVFWGLSTAVSYSGYVLGLKLSIPRLGECRRHALMTGVPLFTALYIGAFMLATSESFVIPSFTDLGLLLALGLLCQAVGWLFITRGMQGVSAALVGLGLLLQPLLSYVWDVVFFAKPLGMAEVTGAALALIGIYLGLVSGKR